MVGNYFDLTFLLDYHYYRYMRISLSILGLLVVLMLTFPVGVLAQTLQLNRIGSMDVSGVSYDHWWYTNTSVTFTGIADANATVTATIDGTAGSATADASGNWSYAATLTEGEDHAVSFASGGSTISLTLTIGPVPADVGTATTTTTTTTTTTATSSALPEAGVSWVTLLILMTGGVLVTSGLFLRKAYQV